MHNRCMNSSVYGRYTDHPGCCHIHGKSRNNPEIFNFLKLPGFSPSALMTFQDLQGSTRSFTVAVRLTFRIVLDMIRVDPAMIRAWGFNFKIVSRVPICTPCSRVEYNISRG
ncbi:hypothetical protein DPMN_117797 [Dreissena polymorpha]|uniref:Uncharacterized protein n=1 Tax=Dreissena polymorpha TaxID=45954 RepID=A0A9D4GIZ3_DREPO|nr:hypothetical protein DPMN_117797 [Dreissena polymorpha]